MLSYTTHYLQRTWLTLKRMPSSNCALVLFNFSYRKNGIWFCISCSGSSIQPTRKLYLFLFEGFAILSIPSLHLQRDPTVWGYAGIYFQLQWAVDDAEQGSPVQGLWHCQGNHQVRMATALSQEPRETSQEFWWDNLAAEQSTHRLRREQTQVFPESSSPVWTHEHPWNHTGRGECQWQDLGDWTSGNGSKGILQGKLEGHKHPGWDSDETEGWVDSVLPFCLNFLWGNSCLVATLW